MRKYYGANRKQKAPGAVTPRAKKNDTHPMKNEPRQVNRILEIAGEKYLLDSSITKEEALTCLDILSKGMKTLEYTYSTGTYREHYFADRNLDVAVRCTDRIVYPTREAAQHAADAHAAKIVAEQDALQAGKEAA